MELWMEHARQEVKTKSGKAPQIARNSNGQAGSRDNDGGEGYIETTHQVDEREVEVSGDDGWWRRLCGWRGGRRSVSQNPGNE